MQEIAIEIDAQRVGRASGYLGGLTVERYTFAGATIPPGTRLAILTRAGVTIAAAEITEGNAATVDTNTQEVADLLRYQPLGACESVYIALGNADTIIALIPATMRKNWLDDEATHPPVPANRYPTKTELDEWLARFDERAAAAETAKEAAQEAAAQAASRAEFALAAKTEAQSAATVAQTAQGKAEDAQAAAETAQKGADAAKTAAASSATAADNSASAAAKSATDLADAVATAESLDGRILKLEKGKGVYQASDGSIQIYTPFDLCADGTLKAVTTVGKFKRIVPVEIDDADTNIWFTGDSSYIYFLADTGAWNKNLVFVYTHAFERVAKYQGLSWIEGVFGGCFRNDRLYFAQTTRGFLVRLYDKNGALLKSFVPEISGVDGNSIEDSNQSMFFYNPKSGHICCYAPQPNDSVRPTYVFAFDEDLNQIVDDDGTYRVREHNLATRYVMQSAIIHDTAYLFPVMNGWSYEDTKLTVFRVTEDDRLEVVRESVPRTDEAGNILYMTKQVTDENGNVTEEIAKDEFNSRVLLPQTDDGDEIRYKVAINDKENRPLLTAGGAFRVRPVVRYSDVKAQGLYKSITYFDGVDTYLILKDGRWVDLWRLNNPFDGTQKKLRAKNDRSSAFTKRTMRIYSCGTEWYVWGASGINNVLVYDAASSVPFSNYHSLSVQFDGSITRGTDIMFDLSLGNPANGEYGSPFKNCLIRDNIGSACIFGSNPWVTKYGNIINGGY